MTQIGDFWGNDGVKSYYLSKELGEENNKFVEFDPYDEDLTYIRQSSVLEIEILSEDIYEFSIRSRYNFIVISINKEGHYINDCFIGDDESPQKEGNPDFPLINTITERLKHINHRILSNYISSPLSRERMNGSTEGGDCLEAPEFEVVKELMHSLDNITEKILRLELN